MRRRHREGISREKKCWDFQVSQDLLQHNSDFKNERCNDGTSWRETSARQFFLRLTLNLKQRTIMDPRVLNELLKRRGNKRHNFRVWNSFMEDWQKRYNKLSFLAKQVEIKD